MQGYIITLHNVCAVHWGISLSTPGGVQYTGGYHEYTGGVQYSGEIPRVQRGVFSTQGDTMMSVGDIMSTSGDVQYTGVFIQIQLFSQ